MNRKTILSLGSALVALGVMSVAGYGCGDDDTATTTKDSGPINNPETGPTPEAGTPDTGGPIPAPPALGAQIDRMGRPAINTALNATFETDAGTKGTKKDAYNADNAQAGWVAKNTPEMAGNLAIFDSLDTVCGNQFLAQDGGASPSNLKVYGVLAALTADDRLWLNTAGTTCNQYLGVEGTYAAGAGLLPSALSMPNECGGRALAYDVIDLTYSAVAVGALAGVSDGVAADPTKTGGTAFPFLAPPTQ